jgi:ribosomal protein S18 acetylase RimI-like enzyme
MKLDNKYIIRKLEKSDIDTVVKQGLTESAFNTESGAFWTKEQLESWSESKDDVLLVAEINEEVIGFALFASHTPTKKVTWENLYVLPEYRKMGIAKALTEGGLHKIKELGHKYVMLCANSDDNESFLKFMETFGFKVGPKVLWVDKVID